MNRLLVLILLFLAILPLSCVSGIPNGYVPISKNANEELYIKNDKFQKTSFVHHKHFFDKDEPIEIYYAKEKKRKYHRIVFRYSGKSWIFFKSAILLNIKGETMKFNFKSFNKKTNVSNGYVYESIDLHLGKLKVKKLEKLLRSKGEIKVRLTGKNYRVYEIDADKIKALLRMLNYL